MNKFLALWTFYFICCCPVDGIDASTSMVAIEGSNSYYSETMANAYFNYFRFNGVGRLIVVTCQKQPRVPDKESPVSQLVRHLMKRNIFVRVFSGFDYMSESEMARHPRGFTPPRTFHADNGTRRPLRLHLPPSSFKLGILVPEFGTPCARNVLRWGAASEHNYFSTNRFWLLLTSDAKQLELLEDEDIFMPPDSEVRVVVQPHGSFAFTLIDVYKITAKWPLKRRVVGSEMIDASDLIEALQRFGAAIWYRGDLEGASFKAGLVIAFPDLFKGIEDMSLRHIDTISKVNNRLTEELANKLNMRYQTDNYGWHRPNHSFNGLMGQFQRYEVDFALNAIFMRLDRIALCDFVAETFRIRAGLMFRQPPLSAVANIFSLPFGDDVWIAIIILLFLATGVLTMEVMYSPHHHQIDRWDCASFVWGAMCQQGFYVAVYNRSARITFFTIFVSAVFLFTSFSANIVALLQTPSTSIHSLTDLSNSRLEIGVQDTVYNKIYFNETTDPVTSYLYHKKIAPKGDQIFMRPLAGIRRMRKELFAFQIELQAGYQIISDTFSESEKCGLMEIEPFQLPMIAIPTRKNFPYKELFRTNLRWQREVGLMNREELKWFPQKPKCEGSGSAFISIGVIECRYALGMFVFGMLLGMVVLLFELTLDCAVRTVRKRRRSKKLYPARQCLLN